MLAVIIGKRTPPAPGEHDGGDQYIRPDYMTFGRGCESVIARSPFGARERRMPTPDSIPPSLRSQAQQREPLRTGPLAEYRANAELQEEAMRCDVDRSYHYDGSGPMPRL